MRSPVAIAFGSNLGDRRAHIQWAAAHLEPHVSGLRLSTIIETEPVGVHEPQPLYLNAVAVGETALGPGELLDVLLALERERGRLRLSRLAPRTLDLDLILFGDLAVNTPSLAVPHPRFRERRFVLQPLAEIAPDWRDPVTQKTVRELLDELRPVP
jgi:2-amino-4-hydroxy-6-hydroxymethyldihydropteridine diphosphokinase